MKRKIFASAALLLLSGVVAIANVVPDQVLKAFKDKFNTAEPYLWDANENGFVAYFEADADYFFCRFDANGKWTETGSYIFAEDLPTKVAAAFNKLVPGMTEASEIYKSATSDGKTAYMFLLAGETEKDYFLVSDAGTVLRKEKYSIPEETLEEGGADDDWK